MWKWYCVYCRHGYFLPFACTLTVDAPISSIINDTPVFVDGWEGRKSVELINAIYESIETEKTVYLQFKPKKCKLGIR